MLKIPVDLGDGPADALLCSRRPVYEAVVRQALTAEPIVTVPGQHDGRPTWSYGPARCPWSKVS